MLAVVHRRAKRLELEPQREHVEEQLSALGRDLAEVKPSTDVSQAEWEKGLLPPPTPYLVASCLYALRREQEARSSV